MKIELPVSLELLTASEWAFEVGAGGVAQLKGVRATSRMPDGHFNYTSHNNYRDLLGSLHPALVFSAQETKFAFSVGTGRGDLDHKVLVPIGVDGSYPLHGNFPRQERPKPKGANGHIPHGPGTPAPVIYLELHNIFGAHSSTAAMSAAAPSRTMATDQDSRISEAVGRERARLRNFIRRRVPDREDAEDILQDVFYELVQAYRTMQTIEQASAWLFRVARNKMTDMFRKKRPGLLEDEVGPGDDEDESLGWQELLRSDDAGPEAEFLRTVLADELDEALSELPKEQQQVFVATEVEGRSFKEIAEETGVGLNTLLSRKRYAVLHLRRRLQTVYEEFKTRSVR